MIFASKQVILELKNLFIVRLLSAKNLKNFAEEVFFYISEKTCLKMIKTERTLFLQMEFINWRKNSSLKAISQRVWKKSIFKGKPVVVNSPETTGDNPIWEYLP